MARSGRAVPWPTLAWLGVFAAIGLYAQRGLAWWSLAGAVAVIGLLPRAADAPEPATPPTLRRLNVVVAAVLVLAGSPCCRCGARPMPGPAFRSAS